MTLAIWYCILMLLALLFGLYAGWSGGDRRAVVLGLGTSLLPWLLFVILGLAQFGSPVK